MNFTLSLVNPLPVSLQRKLMKSESLGRKPQDEVFRIFRIGTSVKSVPGQYVTQPNKKDLLVTLASRQKSLAHKTPMHLKPKNEIVRQIWEPEARQIISLKGQSVHLCIGSITVKVLPLPISLSTLISPP